MLFLNFPVLFITSFYDIYTEGVFDMWESLSPESRSRCSLLVTPFDHNYRGLGTPTIPYANGKLEEMWKNFKVEWFKAIRDGRTPAFVTPGKTTWHAQHEGVWRTAPSMTDGAKEVVFHLNDHALGAEAGEETEITYTYNPYNPAEFKGGCCNNFGGQQLQEKPDSRYDIISFLSASLGKAPARRGKARRTLTYHLTFRGRTIRQMTAAHSKTDNISIIAKLLSF